MLRPDIVRFSLVTAAVLIPQAAAAQPPRVDLRAHWGYTHVLDDTPPQAWVGGGSLTAAVGPNLRLGVEVLHANMFGKYSHYRERARLITPVAEYEFRLSPRFKPYMVIGIGYTQYRKPSRQGQ